MLYVIIFAVLGIVMVVGVLMRNRRRDQAKRDRRKRH